MKKKRNMKRWYENRRDVISSYRIWFWARIVKVFAVVIFLGVFSQAVDSHREARRLNAAVKNAQAAGKDVKSDPDVRRRLESGKAIPPLLGLSSLLLAFISAPIAGMCQELQKTSQDDIDSDVLGRATPHWFELFPHKGIRTHRRELRTYKRRVRRFKRVIRKNRVKTTRRG